MNRPEARNALSTEMMRIMEEAWDRVDGIRDPRRDPHRRGRRVLRRHGPQAMNRNAPGDTALPAASGTRGLPALLKGRRLINPLIAAVEGAAIAGGTEILQGTDIRVAGECPLRRRRGSLGPLPARWQRRAAAAPDPVHDRRRSAADRPPHHRTRGQGIRPHRPRRPRRHRADTRPGDRRDHRRQRAVGRPGDPQDDARFRGACTRKRPSRPTAASASACSGPPTPRSAPARLRTREKPVFTGE